MHPSPQIFLSYPRKEKAFSIQLATELKARGFNIWVDVLDTIYGGDDWRIQLQQAIDSSILMISILCPAYIESTYCRIELSRAKDRIKIPIVPVLFKDLEKETDHPIEIERIQHIDFSKIKSKEDYQTSLNDLIKSLQQQSAKPTLSVSREEKYLLELIKELESPKYRGILEYVDVELSLKRNEQTRPDPSQLDEWGYSFLLSKNEPIASEPRSIQITYSSIFQVIDNTSRFVLLGNPGAGKSTTLRRMALYKATQYLQNPRIGKIPMLINLSTWKESDSFDSFIASQNSLRNVLEDSSTEYCYLFDGLNEMGKNTESKIGQINQWLTTIPDSTSLVIACRKTDYVDTYKLNLYTTIELRPLSKARVQIFSQNYLGDKAQIFLESIFTESEQENNVSHGLQRLAQNPYLLSALIILFQDGGKLPRNIGLLFDKLTKALWKREHLRSTQHMIPYDDAKKSFAKLAFSIINDDVPLTFSEKYAERVLGDEAHRIIYLGQRTNFLEVNNDQIRFYHQLILEFFVAVHLRTKDIKDFLNELDEPLYNNKLERVHSKWDKSIIALCGLMDIPEDELLWELVEFDPLLVVMCKNNGIEISFELQQELQDQLELYNYNLEELVDDVIIEENIFDFLFSQVDDFDFNHHEVTSFWHIYGHYSSIKDLCEILSNDLRVNARLVAVLGLYEFGTNEAIPYLIEALDDPSWFVATNAAQALMRIGGKKEIDLAYQFYQNEGRR